MRSSRNPTLVPGRLIGFALASLVAGLASSFPVLVTARVAQGCFGALLAPTSQALLNITFTERAERERVFAIFGATGALEREQGCSSAEP